MVSTLAPTGPVGIAATALPSSVPQSSTMLLSLQYARAVAALLVVYAHLSGFALFSQFGLPEFGGMGVDLFFVISGFVMWESAQKHTAGDFVWRRVARIVPAYWFYTSILVLIALVAPALAPKISFDGWALAGSYFFVPYTNAQGLQNPILLQGWTLNYEAFFYAIFAVALLSQGRRRRFIFVAGVLLCLCASSVFFEPRSAAVTMATSPMLLEFLFGMGISVLLKRWAPQHAASLALAVLGGSALIAAEIVLKPAGWRALQFGVPASLLLIGLIGMEQVWRRRPFVPLLRVGDASYSLYLCHPFVLSAAALAMRRLSPLADAAVVGVAFAGLGLVGSCVLAWLSFQCLEKPLARRLLGRSARTDSGGSAARSNQGEFPEPRVASGPTQT